MKGFVRKTIALLFSAVLCFPLIGCGKDPSDEVVLLIDLHGWMPSTSTITSAGSQPYTATQTLAEEFMKREKNIKIKWATTKPVGKDSDTIATWFTTSITSDSCPAIAFTWGTEYQDRDWYVSLDEYLETPNEYEEGNTKWKDMFEDYLWQLNTVSNAKGNVVAVPLVLYAGTATGYYYNQTKVAEVMRGSAAFGDAFADTDEEDTAAEAKVIASQLRTYTNFTSVIDLVKDEYGNGVSCVAPSSDVGGITFGSWIQSFCLGPSYAGKLMDKIDYDGDGEVSSVEQVRATLEGYFNPVTYKGAREMLARLHDYYNRVLEAGWQSTDYDAKWKSGNVAFKESGIWSYNTEASTVHGTVDKPYTWGVIPSPMIGTDSGSAFVSEIRYTDSGFSDPTPDLQVNIMKPAVEGKPEVLAAAVKFLKFLTTVENNEYMIGVKDSGLPSVKGAEYPATITESGYTEQSFPIAPKADWPAAFTSDQNYNLNQDFRSWIGDKTVDPWDYASEKNIEFYTAMNEYQMTGARKLVQSLGIDTTGWNI